MTESGIETAVKAWEIFFSIDFLITRGNSTSGLAGKIVSTHHSCRWDSTDPARTQGPHTLSGGRRPRSTAPRRSAHIGTSHTGIPG